MILFIFFAFFRCCAFIPCASVLSLCHSLVVKRVHIYEKQVLVEGDMLLVEVFLIVVVYRYEALYAAFGHFVSYRLRVDMLRLVTSAASSRFRLHR